MEKGDLLDDLERWQAGSQGVLANRGPEELFDSCFVQRYKQLHRDLWHRLIHVHGTLSTLERLEKFPFDALYGPHDMEFWRLVNHNFFITAVVMMRALVSDPKPNAHTVRSFCDRIVTGPWLRSEDRELFMQTLQERRFDSIVKAVAERVEEIRHCIAHRFIDKSTGSLEEPSAGVSLKQLRRLFDATHLIFGALSFGGCYITLVGDLTPTTVGGMPQPTCLDTVLTAILRDSYFVNMAERRAEWWPMERQHINPEELRLMNELRGQIGLPDA
jgi:hypothetical protein